MNSIYHYWYPHGGISKQSDTMAENLWEGSEIKKGLGDSSIGVILKSYKEK